MTYSGHPLSLAAAEACINIYRADDLIENSRVRGDHLKHRFDELQEAHVSIGETRGMGLFHVIELVKNRRTREPMSGSNQPQSEPMMKIRAYLREHGLFTSVRWNWIFCAAPLIITDGQIDDALGVVDGALGIADAIVD
jgi:taurine--2-oxoglutarate transaminase